MSAIFAAWATIIGAIIAAGSTAISAGVASSDLEDAQEQGLGLANQKRADTLAATRAQERLAKLSLAQREKEAREVSRANRAAERESKLGRRQKASEFAAAQREAQFGKTLALINNDQAMRNNFANLFKRGA